MKETDKDLFSLIKHFDAICITTNGIVDDAGRAVMGAGLALECARRWPRCPEVLGRCLQDSGGRNIPYQMEIVDVDGKPISSLLTKQAYICRIISFPTKNHYSEKSDITLIKESCAHLVMMANVLELQHIALTRVGCGLGKLSWDTVKAAIAPILDDRFCVTHVEKQL